MKPAVKKRGLSRTSSGRTESCCVPLNSANVRGVVHEKAARWTSVDLRARSSDVNPAPAEEVVVLQTVLTFA